MMLLAVSEVTMFHVSVAVKAMLTSWPAVAEPMVTAPAPVLTVMPPDPSVSNSVPLPPVRVVVPVLLKVSELADWLASSVMVLAPFAVVMLKMTSSPIPGMANGSGVVAFDTVDQFETVAHDADVPSQ